MIRQSLPPFISLMWGTPLPLVALCAVLVLAGWYGCNRMTDHPTLAGDLTSGIILPTGEELLINALDEVDAIAEMTGNGSRPRFEKPAADSVYVYGEVTQEGLGVVVTERHAYPKGLLLITVRKSFGRNGHVVSETRRYITYESFRADQPQQTTVTEIIPSSRDTIVTHVLRNGTLETYTFRLPVITRLVHQADSSVQVTSRYARDGASVSEVTDGTGSLVRRTTSTALPSGALQTRTDYADGSWRIAVSLGRADGSIFREITTGP